MTADGNNAVHIPVIRDARIQEDIFPELYLPFRRVSSLVMAGM
jgi:hypothetical protein